VAQLEMLAEFFKALGDENRLRILGLVSDQERSVGELAELLSLSEPTVSHHLARLREQGLLNLRAAGTVRLYRLNREMLERLLTVARDVDALKPQPRAPKPDMSWIDALELAEEDRKVLRDYCVGQRLKEIPTKQKKLLAVLRWAIQRFESGRRYTEREVSALLKEIHPDYARLRRELVETGLLAREGGGGQYWRVAATDPRP